MEDSASTAPHTIAMTTTATTTATETAAMTTEATSSTPLLTISPLSLLIFAPSSPSSSSSSSHIKRHPVIAGLPHNIEFLSPEEHLRDCFVKVLKSLPCPYRVVKVEGDGNCFYRVGELRYDTITAHHLTRLLTHFHCFFLL